MQSTDILLLNSNLQNLAECITWKKQHAVWQCCNNRRWIGLCSVFTSPPTQYRLYGRRFYRSEDPTNSIKVL